MLTAARAVFVVDTNLPTVYSETVGLDKTSELLRGLSAARRVVLTTSGWHEQAQLVGELLGVPGMDVLSGDGCVLKPAGDAPFRRAGFIRRNDGDVIVHLAVLSVSGIYVKGAGKEHDGPPNASANYFLNHRAAHKFHDQWRFSLEPNTDYATFAQRLLDMRVSEIYVLREGPGFAERFLGPDGNLSALVSGLDAHGRNVLRDTWLFTANPPAKAEAFARYAAELGLPAGGMVYVSLGEFDARLAALAHACAVPDALPDAGVPKGALRYSLKRPNAILPELLRLADAADAAATARRTRIVPTA